MPMSKALSPRRRGLLGGLLVLVVAVLGYLVWQARLAPASNAAIAPTEPPAVPAEVVTAIQRDVPTYLTGIGTVKAFNTVTVTSRVDGMLDRIAFTEGQTVKAGDLLAQIDPRPFQAALDQAVAKKAQDEAQLANAKLDLQRFTNLAAHQFTPVQQLDTQRATVAQLEAQIRGDQASIDASQTQLGYTTIASPIDGRIGIRLVDQGNIVHATDSTGIVVVTQLQPISVVFTLPEQDLGGGPAALAAGTVECSRQAATARGSRRRVRSRSSTTRSTRPPARSASRPRSPIGTARSGRANSSTSACWPGPSRTPSPSRRPRCSAGPGLLRLRRRRRRPGGMRPVQVGQIADGIAVIQAGLSPGEAVVASGQYRLVPGARVARQGAALTGAPANERLGPLHPPTGRDLAAHAGHRLVGVVAFPLLPVAPLPQVDFPTIQVSAQLPGASPETMASSVAQPLERQFAPDRRASRR